MINLNKKEKKALEKVASALGLDPLLLWGLIQFESKWNPKIKNPYSSARGLIQFINSTAVGLGYKSSLDLVEKHPTTISQLYYPVFEYLKQFKPFPTSQSLFMAVFYPRARQWPELKAFPDNVQKVNPGIKTPLDYMKKVYSVLKWRYVPRLSILIAGVIGITIFIKKQR